MFFSVSTWGTLVSPNPLVKKEAAKRKIVQKILNTKKNIAHKLEMMSTLFFLLMLRGVSRTETEGVREQT